MKGPDRAEHIVAEAEGSPAVREAVARNEEAWDLRTKVHLTSQFYDVDGFLAGASTLKPPELALAGDVSGKDLLHLQCHFGLDTLSWSRLGARATGVDLSGASIRAARRLSRESGVPATFVQADVQTLEGRWPGAFDLVVTSYGVLCWLGDLAAWARGIRSSLRPGGRLVLVEFHPLLDVLFDGVVSGRARYLSDGKPCCRETTGTYTDRASDIAYSECLWQHPLSEVVGALLEVRLVVTDLREYPYSSYRVFPRLDRERDGVWWSSATEDAVPYMYSIVAVAP